MPVKSRKTPVGGPHFSSVRKAREALRARAEELLEGYINTIKMAVAAGDYETATKAYQYLLEHMPDEDGTRLIDQSIDKPKVEAGSKGPSHYIGIAIGGIPQKHLPPAVDAIDVEPSS